MRYPPIVSKPSRSMSTPSRSVSSSMSTLALKTQVSSGSATIGSASTSYSSRISPTSSSTRSSTVTSPAVPPYSSTTSAVCLRVRCNSLSSSGARLVSGTTCAGRTSPVNGSASSWPAPFRNTSFMCTKPTTSSRLSR